MRGPHVVHPRAQPVKPHTAGARRVAVALLDRTIGERRPGCVKHAARTSAFIPMPLRRTRR